MSKSTLLCILFLGLGFSAFAQFYVQQGVVLNLETPKTTLSVQEAQLHINAPIQGQGTLVLNSSELQTLSSTQSVLEVSKLSLEHAHLVNLNTALRIEQQLTLRSGVLYLTHPLYLTDQTALVLLNNSRIQSEEFLNYDLQLIDHAQLQWVWTHRAPFQYTTQPKPTRSLILRNSPKQTVPTLGRSLQVIKHFFIFRVAHLLLKQCCCNPPSAGRPHCVMTSQTKLKRSLWLS